MGGSDRIEEEVLIARDEYLEDHLLNGPEGQLLGGWNYPIDTHMSHIQREWEEAQARVDTTERQLGDQQEAVRNLRQRLELRRRPNMKGGPRNALTSESTA